MNQRELQVNRQPVKHHWIRRIHAKIKHSAATAAANPADLDGEVPNMNVGRAIIVIVILQVVGVAGFFAHRYFEQNNPTAKGASSSDPQNTAAVTADRQRYDRDGRSATPLPRIQRGDDRHMVLAGDTYASIARKWNIDDEALRAANQHINLCSGLVLRVPPREADPAPTAQALANGDTHPPRAILARPNINIDNVPRAIPVSDISSSNASGYRVRKGDTFSKIARDHGLSVNSLMKHNGITNDRSLREGQLLKIPNTQH